MARSRLMWEWNEARRKPGSICYSGRDGRAGADIQTFDTNPTTSRSSAPTLITSILHSLARLCNALRPPPAPPCKQDIAGHCSPRSCRPISLGSNGQAVPAPPLRSAAHPSHNQPPSITIPPHLEHSYVSSKTSFYAQQPHLASCLYCTFLQISPAATLARHFRGHLSDCETREVLTGFSRLRTRARGISIIQVSLPFCSACSVRKAVYEYMRRAR